MDTATQVVPRIPSLSRRRKPTSEQPTIAPAVELGAPVELVMEPGERVMFRPTGLDGSFSLRVRDRDGAPLYDDGRNGTHRMGGGAMLLVPGEHYTVEVFCPGYEVGRKEFEAGRNPVVEIPMRRS